MKTATCYRCAYALMSVSARMPWPINHALMMLSHLFTCEIERRENIAAQAAFERRREEYRRAVKEAEARQWN